MGTVGTGLGSTSERLLGGETLCIGICTLIGAVGGGGVFLAGEPSRLDTVFEGCLESLSS